VRVQAFDGDGRAVGEPVEVQGSDGSALSPALAPGLGAVGLVTRSASAVGFHRVQLGPCATPPSR
jgi:hypothetical protein